MTTSVVCVFVQGEYPYTIEWVYRLRGMVERWIDRPYRFFCLTDQPFESEHVRCIKVTRRPGCFAYWTKLELFNPARDFDGDRVFYLDLDTLIVAPLAPILDVPAPFAITADPTGKTGRDTHDRQIVRRFNSSVMVWDGGTQAHLYEHWTSADARRLSGDQDWIGEQSPDAYAMSRSWFPRLSEITGPPFGDAKVILSKYPKNDAAVSRYPWVRDYWGAA